MTKFRDEGVELNEAGRAHFLMMALDLMLIRWVMSEVCREQN